MKSYLHDLAFKTKYCQIAVVTIIFVMPSHKKNIAFCLFCICFFCIEKKFLLINIIAIYFSFVTIVVFCLINYKNAKQNLRKTKNKLKHVVNTLIILFLFVQFTLIFPKLIIL